MADAPSKVIKSVEHSFAIVDSLTESGPQGVSAIANAVGMPKSTVHVHLQTLCKVGYVVRRGDEYDVSLRFLETGSVARRRRRVYRAGRGEVDQLATQTGEAAHLGVEENGQRVILYKSETGEAIYDNTPTGEFTDMHWTAIGKVLLAHLPESRRDSIVDASGLPRATGATITDRVALSTECERIRERGYAVEDEERREGVTAVAVPIADTDAGEVVASMSVSGPRQRITKRNGDGIRDDVLDELRNHANVTELRFNHY